MAYQVKVVTTIGGKIYEIYSTMNGVVYATSFNEMLANELCTIMNQRYEYLTAMPVK